MGERVTLADISVVCNLLLPYKQVIVVVRSVLHHVVLHRHPLLQVFDAEFRAPYGNVNRWFVTCVNQPQFKTVLGPVELCVQMAQFDGEGEELFCIGLLFSSIAEKYNQLFPKEKKKEKAGAEEKEAKKPKKESSEKPKKTKEPPPAKAKVEEPKEAEEDDDVPKEPKFNDPYADLPKRLDPP